MFYGAGMAYFGIMVACKSVHLLTLSLLVATLVFVPRSDPDDNVVHVSTLTVKHSDIVHERKS